MAASDPREPINPSSPAPDGGDATGYRAAPADPDATGYRTPAEPADEFATSYRAAPTDPEATGYTPTKTAPRRGAGQRVLPCRFGDYRASTSPSPGPR
jgi:hypothetical protein